MRQVLAFGARIDGVFAERYGILVICGRIFTFTQLFVITRLVLFTKKYYAEKLVA